MAIFLVKTELPKGVTAKEMEKYIREAIHLWKGSFDLNNPLSNFKKFTVKQVKVEEIVATSSSDMMVLRSGARFKRTRVRMKRV